MSDLKSIDWNKMSELGLLERINREILHPLGLAASRDVKTGFSSKVLIADDKEWTYGPKVEVGPILTKEEIFDNLERSGIVEPE